MQENAGIRSDLAVQYASHVEAWMQRVADALAACGFDALCVFAGSEAAPPRDDVRYPFRIEPYFKLWVPLTYAPGSSLLLVPGHRPRLVPARIVYLQPEQMPEAVRQEGSSDAGLQGLVGAAANHSMLPEHASEKRVRALIERDKVNARVYLAAKRLLQSLH